VSHPVSATGQIPPISLQPIPLSEHKIRYHPSEIIGKVSALLRVTEYLKRWLGSHFRFYRLVFNLVAIATLIPVILYGQSILGPVVFRWEGFMIVIQVLL